MTTLARLLIPSRQKILEAAARNALGVVERPVLRGFDRTNWDRNAATLCDAGLLRGYVHGGYEITDEGRAALLQISSSQVS